MPPVLAARAKWNAKPRFSTRGVDESRGRNRERSLEIERTRERFAAAKVSDGRSRSRSLSAGASGHKDRLSCTVSLMNLGGMRKASISLDYMLAAVLDAPTFVLVILEMWDEFYDAILAQKDFPWTAARRDNIAVLAKKPLAKCVNILAYNELEWSGAKGSTFALAEVVWDTWTVMNEPAFRLLAGHIHYKAAKTEKGFKDYVRSLARVVLADSDDSWALPGITGTWSKFPRVLCIDGNMALFGIPRELALAGIQATLMAHHAEFPKDKVNNNELVFKAVGPDCDRGSLLLDSMGIFALGKHEGFRSHGYARKALQGFSFFKFGF